MRNVGRSAGGWEGKAMIRPAADRITGSNFAYQHLSLERFLDDMATLEREHLEL
jgi:protein FrlC